MNILIMDDAKDTGRVIKRMLKSAGYQDLKVIGSAKKAIQLLNRNSANSKGLKADLIIMNMAMSDLDGVEACQKIKSIPGLYDIPIIMVSANKSVKKLDKAFAAGAMDFIYKPIRRVELLVRVNTVLKLKEETERQQAKEKDLLNVKQQLEKSNEDLKQRSIIDDLTGVFNKRYFDLSLKKEWRRAHRRLSPISLVLLEIDFFKDYNDTYGQQMGDRCLLKVATKLAKFLKRPGDLVARYGVEEFSIILPETDQSGALYVAQSMQDEIAQLNIPYLESQVSDRITISAGVATMAPARIKSFTLIPTHLAFLKLFIDSAEKALYCAKNSGRNQVECASEFEFVQVED